MRTVTTQSQRVGEMVEFGIKMIQEDFQLDDVVDFSEEMPAEEYSID